MKVILTGATGLIGGGNLRRLLALPSITSIVVLSRRELLVQDPKLQVIILKDFLNYDSTTLDQLAGAEACIWALGSPTSGKEVHMDYTMAAAKAFEESVLPKLPEGKKFSFVYTSGMAVVADQKKFLLIAGGIRKMRGEIENKLVEMDAQNPKWQTFIVRPAIVTKGEPMLSAVIGNYYIPTDELGAAMVDLAVNGAEKQKFDNPELKVKGKAAVKSLKELQ